MNILQGRRQTTSTLLSPIYIDMSPTSLHELAFLFSSPSSSSPPFPSSSSLKRPKLIMLTSMLKSSIVVGGRDESLLLETKGMVFDVEVEGMDVVGIEAGT